MNVDDTDKFLEDVKVALTEIDELPISEHGDRYERLHRNLESALSSIDGL
ncbi:MAG: hypothetical protein WDO06_04635 [Actinomycetota bacterium]